MGVTLVMLSRSRSMDLMALMSSRFDNGRNTVFLSERCAHQLVDLKLNQLGWKDGKLVDSAANINFGFFPRFWIDGLFSSEFKEHSRMVANIGAGQLGMHPQNTGHELHQRFAVPCHDIGTVLDLVRNQFGGHLGGL